MGESLTGEFGAPGPDSDSGAEDIASVSETPLTSENEPESEIPAAPEGQLPLSPEPWAEGTVAPAGNGDAPAESAPVSPAEGTSVDEVVTAVDGLAEQVRKFQDRSESQENIIRQMQSRIEQLQGDQVQALLKPLLRRLAGVHAQAAEAAERARERGEKSEKDFDFFMDSIEEALGLIDVESVEAAPSAEFDSAKHHAARVVPTGDAAMDKRIHRVVRQGFSYVDADRVFLPAQVSVYRYQPPQ